MHSNTQLAKTLEREIFELTVTTDYLYNEKRSQKLSSSQQSLQFRKTIANRPETERHDETEGGTEGDKQNRVSALRGLFTLGLRSHEHQGFFIS